MTPSNELTLADRLIPWYFVLFFVVLTIILSFFTWIAVSSFTGVVTEHAYEEGLQYNQIIRKAKAQEALGWKGAIAITHVTPATIHIAVSLNDKTGSPIPSAKGKLTILRPTQAGYDQTLSLKEAKPGEYTADATLPMEGIWDMYAAFEKEGSTFQIKKTIIAKP